MEKRLNIVNIDVQIGELYCWISELDGDCRSWNLRSSILYPPPPSPTHLYFANPMTTAMITIGAGGESNTTVAILSAEMPENRHETSENEKK